MNQKLGVLGAVLALLVIPAMGFAQELTPLERLGDFLYSDRNLSINRNQSCKTCHHPSSSFTDPANVKDPFNRPVSVGSDGLSVGVRKPPSAAYASFSPSFHLDPVEGIFIGGLFWDGRASGATLGDPLAEQAQGPFLNPVEMAMPDKQAVVTAIQASSYAGLFEQVFGPGAFANVDAAYDNMARAIAAFEKSRIFRRFNSRFDQFWARCKELGIDVSLIMSSNAIGSLPQGILTELELRGLAFFNDPLKGNCAACHPTTDFVDENGNVFPPLFTDFSYDNLGFPVNPRIAQLRAQAGLPTPIDYGLGARADVITRQIDGVPMPDGLGGQVTVSSGNAGMFRVSGLRNIGKTMPYGHNGFFATLQDIVNFYNSRDVPGSQWGPPEVAINVNTGELGNLGLSRDEERAIVAFMMTFSDNTEAETASFDFQTGILHVPVVSADFTTETYDIQFVGPFNVLGAAVR